MKGRPLFDNLVVELIPYEEEVSEGGILLVRSFDAGGMGKKDEEPKRDVPAMGKVVAVGNGLPDLTSGTLQYYPMDVKEGDVVCFRDIDGFSMMYEGKPAVLLNIRDILYVNEEQDNTSCVNEEQND